MIDDLPQSTERCLQGRWEPQLTGHAADRRLNSEIRTILEKEIQHGFQSTQSQLSQGA